jgi:putative acetyltransferase
MRIRLATQDDTGAAVDVIKAVYDEYGFTWDKAAYHADLYDLEGAYLSIGNLFWIAENADGRAIGTVALEHFETLPGTPGHLIQFEGQSRITGCSCGLMRLYVKPDARKVGAGSALLNQAIFAARESGQNFMEIWSDKRFAEAHRLYKKFGARIVGDRICDDPDESPEWGLILGLETE